MKRRDLIMIVMSGVLVAIAVDSAFADGVAKVEESVFFRSLGGRAPDESTVPVRLDEKPRWRTAIDAGHSTPVIVGDRIFLTTFSGEQQTLSTVALDRITGQRVWSANAPVARIEEVHRVSNPASATVAVRGNRIFVFFGSYGLLCYDWDGQLIWSRSLGPFQDEFGASSSPILSGDLLFLNEDHDTNNALFAFDQASGQPVWQVPRNEFTRSYATPILATVDGEQQVIVAGALTVTGYEAATGQRRWWIHGLARIVNPTPIVHGDRLFLATWSPGGDVGERIAMHDWATAAEQFDENQDGQIRRDELIPGPVLTRFFRIDIDQDGGLDQLEWEKHADVFQRAQNSVMAVKLGGRGDLSSSNVLWTYQKGVPYVSSPLYHDGVLFLVKDGGILTTLNAETGEVMKQGRLKGRGSYYASPYFADGKVYLASEMGVVTVVRAAGDWEILAHHDFEEPIYGSPTVNDDNLFIRTASALYCFAVAE